MRALYCDIVPGQRFIVVVGNPLRLGDVFIVKHVERDAYRDGETAVTLVAANTGHYRQVPTEQIRRCMLPYTGFLVRVKYRDDWGADLAMWRRIQDKVYGPYHEPRKHPYPAR